MLSKTMSIEEAMAAHAAGRVVSAKSMDGHVLHLSTAERHTVGLSILSDAGAYLVRPGEMVTVDLRADAHAEPEAGRKYDAEKPDPTLLPPKALLAVARVLTFGAKKYARDNWHRVENARIRYPAAALRHVLARLGGEKCDPETGEDHYAHACACLLFALGFEEGDA